MPQETSNPKLELTLIREIDAPPSLVWKAWTHPEHLKQWWAPKPWITAECEMDLRPGGKFRTLMRGPDGTEYDGDGCFLEVVENQRITFTDALRPGFGPSENPFFTAIITLEDLGGDRTRYTARALHKDDEDRAKHESMGFYDGWGTCLTQLAELVATLK